MLEYKGRALQDFEKKNKELIASGVIHFKCKSCGAEVYGCGKCICDPGAIAREKVHNIGGSY